MLIYSGLIETFSIKSIGGEMRTEPASDDELAELFEATIQGDPVRLHQLRRMCQLDDDRGSPGSWSDMPAVKNPRGFADLGIDLGVLHCRTFTVIDGVQPSADEALTELVRGFKAAVERGDGPVEWSI